jgi:hypothetical protein
MSVKSPARARSFGAFAASGAEHVPLQDPYAARKGEVLRRVKQLVKSSKEFASYAQCHNQVEIQHERRLARVYLEAAHISPEMFQVARNGLPPDMRLKSEMMTMRQRDGVRTQEHMHFFEATLDGSPIDGGGSAWRERARRLRAAYRSDPDRNATVILFSVCALCVILLHSHWRGYHEPWCALIPQWFMPTARIAFKTCLISSE